MNAPQRACSRGTRFPRREMLRGARRIGRLLARLDRIMVRLGFELVAGLRDAGVDEGRTLNVGHLVIESRDNIASRLHDAFNAKLDTYARQAWLEHQPPARTVQTSTPPAPASEQR